MRTPSCLPVGTVRRGGGAIKTGRVLDGTDRPNRKTCNLDLAMMGRMGVHLLEFGDSRERLAEV